MLSGDRGGGSPAFTGTRASYVALAAISTLATALLASIWEADVSGSLALLGLLAVYLASGELLVLYLLFTPTSIVVDMLRLHKVEHHVGGRGWLIFFTVLEILCKAVGTAFAWSVHKSLGSGDSTYAPMNFGQPPTYSAPNAFGGGTNNATSYQPNPPSYGRMGDPFAAAYAAPRNEPNTTQPSSNPAPFYSPPAAVPQQQQQQQQPQNERSEI